MAFHVRLRSLRLEFELITLLPILLALHRLPLLVKLHLPALDLELLELNFVRLLKLVEKGRLRNGFRITRRVDGLTSGGLDRTEQNSESH
jgi:hypothetical protein